MATKAKSSAEASGGFTGKIGYVMAAAASAVGLGNIWRFPYLCAKYGGGIFLLVYLILVATFGYTLLVSETMIGRMSKKSPIGAYKDLTARRSHSTGSKVFAGVGGWVNALVPFLICPYYCVIGGWITKYFIEYCRNSVKVMANDDYFGGFIGKTAQPEIYFIVFLVLTLAIILLGVQKGVERFSKMMMPALIVLAIVVSIYSCTRPGASVGLKYLFVPNFHEFSMMTVASALGQLFYSLSIAMGIMITYGSYTDDSMDVDQSVGQIEIFDTLIAILAGLMIIPAIFAFSGGDPKVLQSGPSLMFVTLPKVFNSMGLGMAAGIVFFLLVLFAALTSAISLAETCVATLQDELHWSRLKSTLIFAIYAAVIGTCCVFGYSIWSDFTIGGFQILDFLDFITNSIMMPFGAFFTCILVFHFVTVKKMDEEIELASKFKRKKIYNFNVKYLCPIGLAIIFASSVLNAFGIISM